MNPVTRQTADVVICYSVENDAIEHLRERIQVISQAANDLGLCTYAHVRDTQGWVGLNRDYKSAFAAVFEHIDHARLVLLDLTSDSSSIRTGINLEAGYAKGVGKILLGLWRVPDRPEKTLSIVDFEDSYRSMEDLGGAVISLLKRGKSAIEIES